ncbi:hypothetical protein FOL47_009554 [Perkinsus chesapeaki]|uniref:subtilisin n=1 Tax=Perkinsus chesapeaki TaxID=330153 RepID=A0A7J6L7K9_PERCH|nr:hypothetical protein FOL47_009554 [Perkinsus chesapeaki]
MKFMDGDVIGVDNGSPVNDPLYTYQEKYFEAINIPAAWKRLGSAKTKRRYTLWKELAYKVFEADKAGMLIIVSAGNNGKNITVERKYPCALTTKVKTMLCVAGTEQSEMKLGSFSNFADYVDIAAPGDDITTTGISKGANLYPYESIEGASPAAAIIAGVAAMLYSVAPGISATDIKKILKDTSTKGLKDSSGDKTLPFGRVNADKAVAELLPRW